MEDSPHVNQPIENQELYEKTLKILRREWKWAAASDFFYKFNPMLRLDFLDLADVEHDIIQGSSETIMPVHDTWEQYLRRLYLRRVPDDRVWGTEEEPIAWKELTWMSRLEILYTLCEWQFQTPLKVRQAMKDDSDDAAWVSRLLSKLDTTLIHPEPEITHNFDLGDRLWIQRFVETTPPTQKELKRRKHPTQPSQQAKRKATHNGIKKSADSASKRKGKKVDPPKAKGKLTKPSTSRNNPRTGRRIDRDGWQKVPDSWLRTQEGSSEEKDVTALFDDASDLTDLSEEDRNDVNGGGSSQTNPPDDSESDLTEMDEENSQDEGKPETTTSNGYKTGETGVKSNQARDDSEFVEFETICVTIGEWKEFAERFKNVRSLNERRLYRYVTLVVIPEMEEYQQVSIRCQELDGLDSFLWFQALEEKQKKELKELLRREQLAAAVAAAEARPKRSTRQTALSLVDDERRKTGSQASADGDGSDAQLGFGTSRARRAVARGARWDEEQERLYAKALEDENNDDEEEEKSDVETEAEVSGNTSTRRRRNARDQDEYKDEESEDDQRKGAPVNGLGRPRRAAAVKAEQNRPVRPTRRRRARSESDEDRESDDPFFLSCEVCKKSGWNERDWNEEEFTCSACILKAQNKPKRRGRRPNNQRPVEELSQFSSQNQPPDSEYLVSQDSVSGDAMQIEVPHADSAVKSLVHTLAPEVPPMELPTVTSNQANGNGQIDVDMMSQSPNGNEARPFHHPAPRPISPTSFVQPILQQRVDPDYALQQFPAPVMAGANLWQLPTGNMTNGSGHV
ncbi:15238_t:CDS:2, partial [Acaulospora colombiana]